ncbi:unnamed protein product [Pocillopora meandrina]|uniref:Uncharacterized protein n=1 Tax=Pocillopora meandrina TaxID=46732 RepID=A0AAU9WRY3_9CNID|nr:unnamed protein product [Pocillopora meandrina]
MFYGTVCFTNHVSKTQSGKTADHQQLSVCMSRRKCGNCCKLLVGCKQQQEYRCGYVTCPLCHHYQLRNGAKLLQVTFDRITFIDSLSFFQMPLSAFPKTFGLTKLKKGYFPHLFNTLSNQSYIGRIPDTSYFMPDIMSVSARRDFEAWHT